jgi:heavy metal sensor kinase
MFLKKLTEHYHTLSFRLTLWYAGIFTLSSFAVFLILFLSVESLIYGRMDKELAEDAEEFSSVLNSEGNAALINEVLEEAETEDTEEIFYRLIRADGSEIVASDMSSWENIPPVPVIRLGNEPVFETISLPGKPYNIRVIYVKIAPDIIFHAGILLESESRIMAIFKEVFGAGMIITLFFAVLVGWFMAKRSLAGVEEVTRTAHQIIKGDLEKRVNVRSRETEIEQLVSAFNHMLDRIRKLIKEMQEMTDNIAHDLKSPLTRMRGAAEVTLTSNASLSEYEQMAAGIIEECDSLVEMINTMLDISELETGAGKVELETVEMRSLVQDVCELFEPLAEKKKQRLISNIDEQLFVQGDLKKLRRMVSNLLDNALKYTPESGEINVSLHRNGNKEIILSISDTGTGISPDDLPHVFERFYRSDRSRSETGTGLGLSLVKAIAEAHGGNIRVRSIPNKGSNFTVTLPVRSRYEALPRNA